MAGNSYALSIFFSWLPGCHLLLVSSFPWSPCRSPHLPTRGVGGSVSLNTLDLFSSLCSRAHTVVSHKAMAFGWWAFKISALLSASSPNSAAGCFAPGAGVGGDVLSASLCSGHFTKQEEKKRRSGLTDIKCIVLCKWLVHGNIIPDINPRHTYTYYSRSQCKSSLCDFPHGPAAKNSPCNAGHTGWIPGQGTKIPHAVGQLSLHAAKIPSAAN